jgi:Tfp pilus assembly ATPase PilU
MQDPLARAGEIPSVQNRKTPFETITLGLQKNTIVLVVSATPAGGHTLLLYVLHWLRQDRTGYTSHLSTHIDPIAWAVEEMTSFLTLATRLQ